MSTVKELQAQAKVLNIKGRSSMNKAQLIEAIAIANQPTVEQPTVEPPTVEPPTVEQPTVEPPTVEPPTVEQPIVEQPIVEQPIVEPPTVEPPTVEQPTVEQHTSVVGIKILLYILAEVQFSVLLVRKTHTKNIHQWYVKSRRSTILRNLFSSYLEILANAT